MPWLLISYVNADAVQSDEECAMLCVGVRMCCVCVRADATPTTSHQLHIQRERWEVGERDSVYAPARETGIGRGKARA